MKMNHRQPPTRSLRLPAWYLAAVPAVLLLISSPVVAAGRSFSHEQRIEAQGAIERNYYQHQIGVTVPFDQAVTRSMLEQKVDTYLRQSAALERFWGAPVTGDTLQAEMERIASVTRMPDRLNEIYTALGNDAFLVEETFARAALVDRLSRSFFASDRRIQEAARQEAEKLQADLAKGEMSPQSPDSRRSEIQIVRKTGGKQAAPAMEAIVRGAPFKADDDEFALLRGRGPAKVGEIGPVIEQDDAFLIHVIESEDAAGFTLVAYRVQKLTWDEWWPNVARSYSPSIVKEVAHGAPLPQPAGAGPQAQGAACIP